MDDDISIIERKELDLKGAVLIEGFPSVGMVSTIVSNYLVKQLGLEYVGSVHSRFFYPTAVISDFIPMPPVRIYAGTPKCEETSVCRKIVVLTSEFPPNPELMMPIVGKVIGWTKEKGIELIISVEGILNQVGQTDANTYGIASTQKARDILNEKSNVISLENGVITGISGVLLHEAERANKDVICLLSDAHPDYPDARAAARLIEALDEFLPKLKLDPQPLIDEADKIEKQIQAAIEQARPVLPMQPKTDSFMYG